MSTIRKSKSYFSSGSLPRGVRYDKFMERNKPTEIQFKRLFDSIPFLNDSGDSAKENLAGHVMAASDADVTSFKTPTQYGDGHTRIVQPHQLGLLELSKWEYDTCINTYQIDYGLLYNWYAVNTGKLAPTGYKVPSSSDFNTLSTYLGGNGVSGSKLKSERMEPMAEPSYYSGNVGLNSVNFNALPGGHRMNGNFEDARWGCFMLTTDEQLRITAYGVDNLYTSGPPYSKKNGYSIRCLKVTPSAEDLAKADGEYCDDVVDTSGVIYRSVKIGTQVWMHSNLKTTKYNDGTDIPKITDNTAWAADTNGAYCIYNNEETVEDNGYYIEYGESYICPDFIKPKNSASVKAEHIDGLLVEQTANEGEMLYYDSATGKYIPTSDVVNNDGNLIIAKGLNIGDSALTTIGSIKFDGTHFYGYVDNNVQIRLDNIPGFAIIPVATSKDLIDAITTINLDYDGGFILLTETIILDENTSYIFDLTGITIFGQGYRIRQNRVKIEITSVNCNINDVIFQNVNGSGNDILTENISILFSYSGTVASGYFTFNNCSWYNFTNTLPSTEYVFKFGTSGNPLQCAPNFSLINCFFSLIKNIATPKDYKIRIYQKLASVSTMYSRYKVDLSQGQATIDGNNNFIVQDFVIEGVASYNYIYFISTGYARCTSALSGFDSFIKETRIKALVSTDVDVLNPIVDGEMSFEIIAGSPNKLRIKVLIPGGAIEYTDLNLTL